MGLSGGTPLPDEHLGVLLEDRRFPGISGCSRRWWVSGRCLPYDVSIESFEETDTARRRGVSQAWATRGWHELVGDAGRVVVIGRDQVLIMSWFEPLAGIISDH
jgi:hypothetical protein